jgi:hypothetical protein
MGPASLRIDQALRDGYSTSGSYDAEMEGLSESAIELGVVAPTEVIDIRSSPFSGQRALGGD